MTAEQTGVRAVRSVLALGSNLGARDDTIIDAMAEIGRVAGIEIVACSSLYETVALKLHGLDELAPRYLNAVAIVSTELAPRELLAVLNGIEHSHGRVRDERWGDRTLDIDVITYGSLEQSDEALTLPHPRAWQRDFVLAPWLEIEPDAVLPGRGPVAALLAATDDTARPTTRES
jgi:2-amino-4-hydroxy-6-hydroxymethyldihydropteridine diphosphokinase